MKMMPKSLFQKNKRGQLVTGLIGGVAGLIILVIVSFLIVDTLNDSNLLKTASASATNETTTLVISEVAQTLTQGSGKQHCTLSITKITNSSNSSQQMGDIAAGNYTINACTIAFVDTVDAQAALFNSSKWNITYTATYDGASKASVGGLISNYTAGVDNVSVKVPTILLVAAVVLLFGAIVFLVQRARQTTNSSGGSL